MKNDKLANYECEGQIELLDYLKQLNEALPVDIRGLCDDAYCPKCGSGLDEFKHLDCDRCPECNARISWKPWYKANELCMRELYGENWIQHVKDRMTKTE